jgi:ABC-type bacteriocin/lantibiotic exporter with double-glycine peptidase domain
MKFKEYKKTQEEKALSKVNSVWTWIAWFSCYKTKEFFCIIILILITYIFANLGNPKLVRYIWDIIIKFLSVSSLG